MNIHAIRNEERCRRSLSISLPERSRRVEILLFLGGDWIRQTKGCGMTVSRHLVIFSPVFFVLVEENICVRMVSTPSDFSIFNGFLHGAARFVGVGAVVETAFFGSFEDFWEIMRDAVAFKFYEPECTDARSINNVATEIKR